MFIQKLVEMPIYSVLYYTVSTIPYIANAKKTVTLCQQSKINPHHICRNFKLCVQTARGMRSKPTVFPI